MTEDSTSNKIEKNIEHRDRKEKEREQRQQCSAELKEQSSISHVSIEHTDNADILHIARGSILSYFFKYYMWVSIPTLIIITFPLFTIMFGGPVFLLNVITGILVLFLALLSLFNAYVRTRPLTVKVLKGKDGPLYLFCHRNEHRPLCQGKWSEFSIYPARATLIGGTRFRGHDYSYQGIIFPIKDWKVIEQFEEFIKKKYSLK